MFGRKKVDPQEQAKEWKKQVREQSRSLEHQMGKITREEDKIKLRVKALMKQKQTDAAMPLVKELLASKKAKTRIMKAKVQLDSLTRSIDMQIGQLKVCGAFQKSAEVTKMLNSLVSLPEMQNTFMHLQQEMQTAGMAAEATDEAMDMAQDEDTEDPETAIKLVFNEIAAEANKTPGTQIPLMKIEPEELPAEEKTAAAATA